MPPFDYNTYRILDIFYSTIDNLVKIISKYLLPLLLSIIYCASVED